MKENQNSIKFNDRKLMEFLVNKGFYLLDISIDHKNDTTYTMKFRDDIEEKINEYNCLKEEKQDNEKEITLTNNEIESMKEIILRRIEEDLQYGVDVDKLLLICSKLNKLEMGNNIKDKLNTDDKTTLLVGIDELKKGNFLKYKDFGLKDLGVNFDTFYDDLNKLRNRDLIKIAGLHDYDNF